MASKTRPPSSKLSGAWPDPKDVETVPHRRKLIDVKVTRVCDGDTCEVLIPYEGFLRLKIRVLGIDTPEKRVLGIRKGTHLGKLEEEASRHVTTHVKSLIEGKIMKVRLEKWDKYGGRVDGEIFIKTSDGSLESLTDHLASRKYGRVYHGEGKKDWTEDELRTILK